MHSKFNQATTDYNNLNDYKEKEQFLESVILAKNNILANSNKKFLNTQNQNLKNQLNLSQEEQPRLNNSNNNILSDNQNIMPASRG